MECPVAECSEAVPAVLHSAFNDPRVTDICMDGPQVVLIDRGQGMEQALAPSWSQEDYTNFIFDLLTQAGKTWDAKHPFVDGALPWGWRLHAVFPPICKRGILLSLRRTWRAPKTETSRWDPMALGLLQSEVAKGASVLICGATGSGKTTLLCDLIGSIPGSERLLALEDTPEIFPTHPLCISLLSRPPNADGFGEITLRTLLKQALRMRPDRILLGECRGPEVLDLLQILNTGHRGSLATVHANSPRDALRRLELLCMLAPESKLSASTVRELVAFGINLIVDVVRTPQGRRIREISKIEGKEGEIVLLRSSYEYADSEHI